MKKLAFFIFIIFFHSHVATADGMNNNTLDYKGKLSVIIPNLPKLEDYPAELKIEKPKSIDWKSIPAWKLQNQPEFFQRKYEVQIKNGDVFANNYKIITVGCGTACQANYIISLKTGKMIASFSSRLGYLYKPNSRLLISNAPEKENLELDFYKYYKGFNIDFYELKNEKLIRIKRISPMEIFEGKPEDKLLM